MADGDRQMQEWALEQGVMATELNTIRKFIAVTQTL